MDLHREKSPKKYNKEVRIMKYWQGKFNDGLDEAIGQFISTLPFDKRLYKHDIMGSIAHCTMLGEQGIIEEEETKIILKALTQIFYDITTGKLQPENARDVYEFLDAQLYERVGALAEKLNVARTVCDRSTLNVRMYVKELCSDLNEELKKLIETLMLVSESKLSVVMPSEYHGSKAQPTTLAHALMAFAEAFARDAERLNDVKKHAGVMTMYSGFGTGTPFRVNRRRVAELLQLDAISQNSLDALTDIDFIHDFMSASAAIARHIEKVCNTFIRWSGKEYAYARADASFNIDSEATPQTDTPLAMETIKLKASKCSALAHSADALDERTLSYGSPAYAAAETVFEAESILKNCLNILTALIPSYSFDEQAMQKAAVADYGVAHDCADYLVANGEAKEQAYAITGKLCEYCSQNNKRLDTLPIEIYKEFSPLFEKDIISLMRPKTAVRLRKHDGEPSEVAVRAEIRALKRKLNKLFPQK